MERTCILVKPDAMQRNLLGEIIRRFELKGLKVIGCKMLQLSDRMLDEHYAHHRDKSFFVGLKRFMQSSPIVAMVLEGVDAVEAVRTIVGPTKGRIASGGTIRGDLAMSTQANLVHASDTPAAAEQEIVRFFNTDEIFTYEKWDATWVYAEDERA